MRTRQTVRRAVDPNKYVVVKHKNVVVLCQNEDELGKKDKLKQQCLIVLYKVNSSKDSAKILESTSSEMNS